ncbi:MAG TPA: aminotransferase class I/II-fold pyridoxal phosphate-dependent enzyme, partial [Candidatus Ozemobacteraceae bacterium]|nr:aminotransferase class I/II-fold pyridoxal phosphate-dependent enzyme [Candidatus Ozemobacteraceae bacterium]
MTTERPGFIPNCVPVVRGREAEYVQECLKTGWVSSVGPFVDRFEREFAAYVGARHAVATCNGTAALHLALLCAGVKPGDRVLVPTLTFIATVNPVRYCGAEPLLVDAEPTTANVDPRQILEICERESCAGRRIAAILPAHLYGHPAHLEPILAFARQKNIPVIEDASECLGGRLGERHVGTCGLIGCFSFNGNKLITSGGGGGMLVTDDATLAARAKHLSVQARSDESEYLHDAVGYNYRLTNIHAAFGCAQLEQIETVLAAKRRIHDWYERELQGVPGLTLLKEQPWARSSHWMSNVLVEPGVFGADRRDLLRYLASIGIQTRPFFTPMHRLSMYRASEDAFPVAERLYQQG